MKRRFKQGEMSGEVTVQVRPSRISLEKDGSKSTFEVVTTPGGFALTKDGEVFDVTMGHRADESVELFVNGQPVPLDWIDERRFSGVNGSQGSASEKEIRAIMPGRVVRVHVKPGDVVAAGDPVLVLEAMKMENEIKALVPGTVKEIIAKVGRSVEARGLLVRMEPLESDW